MGGSDITAAVFCCDSEFRIRWSCEEEEAGLGVASAWRKGIDSESSGGMSHCYGSKTLARCGVNVSRELLG